MAILLKKNRIKLGSLLYKRKSIKLKASTLVETLVATVLIVTIFSISSLALNTIFKSVIQKRNNQTVHTRLYELKYLYIHDKVGVKYQESFNNWAISISQNTRGDQQIINIDAIDKTTKKTISKKFVDDHIE